MSTEDVSDPEDEAIDGPPENFDANDDDELIDEQGRESFPASDPPAY